MRRFTALAIVALSVVVASCTGGDNGAPSSTTAPPPPRAGGDATVDNTGANAFAQFVPGLTESERGAFVVGNNFFNDNWVRSPASTTGRDGLGPLFNAQSCSSCHFKDGRGRPADTDKPNALGLLLRLSVPGTDEHGAPLPDPVYGGQLQDKAINGVPVEGTISISNTELTGSYDDGTTYTLQKPIYTIEDPGYGPIREDLMISPRLAPPVFGTGLLEAVPVAQLRSLEDPDDLDGDGISGRANMVWSPTAAATVPGRFGWKANVATVEEQTAAAFQGDVGITSSVQPSQNCTAAQPDCLAAPDGGDPELDDHKLERVTFYTRTLAVPARRETSEEQVARGEELFGQIGCTACHTPELRTGPTEPEPLSEQTIHPYTDLLLHDMGDDLADGRPDFLATGTEWRTPPLWGIGLTETVNRHTRFLHDGRARDLTEAVLWHGGEAAGAQRRFRGLDAAARDALISFLQSL